MKNVMTLCQPVVFMGYIMLFLGHVNPEKIEVCPILGEDLEISCPDNEVIVISSAHYGRMKKSRCLDVEEFIGCNNDVLYLLDQWCSGLNSCHKRIPNPELKAANKVCRRYLHMYLEVEFTCLKVISSVDLKCGDEMVLSDNEGFLSSRLIDDNNCQFAWIIGALPGQVIELSIVDFGSAIYRQERNETGELPLYGHIEDDRGRRPIFGSLERRRLLYISHSNSVAVKVVPAMQRRNIAFLLQYKKKGCPDLSPPAHAWYKRDGDQAVIGCEWSQKTWHLSCDGWSWSGVVGNCSGPVSAATPTNERQAEVFSPLWLVCVVSVSVVLMVIASVIGVVCIKKYRIKQDVQKSMTLQRLPVQGHYDLDPNIEMASMLYLPYKIPEQRQQETLSDPHRPTSYLIPQDQVVNELTPIRIWERPLPELPGKPLPDTVRCTLATNKQGRTPGDGDEAVVNAMAKESDTLQSHRSDLATN